MGQGCENLNESLVPTKVPLSVSPSLSLTRTRIINPILTYKKPNGQKGKVIYLPKVTELTAGLKPRTYHALLSVERQREEKKKKEGRKKSFQDLLETRLRNVGNDVRNYTGQHIRDRIVTWVHH